KVATVATKADDLFDIVRSSKFVTQANKTLDGAKTFVKSNVDKLLDTSFQLGPKLVPAGGSSVGGTTLREVGQNVKKSLDNLVNYFKKNGDEVGKRTEKGTKGTKAVGNMSEFLDSDFGQELRDSLQKTSKRYDGQRVYKVIENIGNLKKGDQIYLDELYKDHLEVFNKNGKVKSVLNLDGSINFEKTRKVLEQGRRLP
ncbi:hypothetical protein, partial [Streptococcus ruminantium]|uniref:hypothetical protein n=1 Tax=Streptococcus ruminantium TaxID=1917441 RepID=UPI001D1391A4